jgi:hypothetical protein
MQNELEDFIKSKMSVDELNIDRPSEKLVIKARKVVEARKRANINNQTLLEGIKSFFYAELKVYQVVLCGLVLMGCFLWFSKPQSESANNVVTDNYLTNKTAITSSTILASIHHNNIEKSSTSTSTALSCIKTFVTKN